MWKLLCLFLLVICPLSAVEEIRLAAESEPLLTVANCVNILGGAFFQVDQDLVVDGPLPLSYTRHYDSGDKNYDLYLFNHYGYGVGLGHPLFVKYIEDRNNGYLYVDQRHRYGVPFALTKGGKKIAKAELHPDIYKQGYTNCTEALERGQPCLAHAELVITGNPPSRPFIDVTDADGTKRSYTFFESNSGSYYYMLRRTDYPNGLTTCYEYDIKGRMKLVALKNTADGEILTSITYNYDDQNNNYTVTGSDGRTVYHNMSSAMGNFSRQSGLVSTPFLKAVSADDSFLKVYWYATANNSIKTYPLLVKVDDPRGGYIFANYKDEKVTSLTAPLGVDGTAYLLYAFDYKKDKTIVTNALGIKNEYCFSHKRLSEVKEGSLRVRGYSWNEKTGQLKSKTIQNPQKNILESVIFNYDNKGNISQKWECGNITGDSPDVYPSKHEFKAGQSDVRSHGYTYGPFCNVLREVSPNGTITNYGYKAGTNLVNSKLVSFNGKIQEREFYDYDKNGILIQKIEDDGTGEDRYDHSNITYWLVTRIQPQMDRNRWGLTKPAVEERSYFDFSIGQEKLLERIEIDYARGGQVAEKRTYDADGALAYQESFRYNGKLLPEEICDRLGRVTRYGYDACFNVISEELVGSGKKIQKNYDLSNRLVRAAEIHDDGTSLSTFYTYDLMGNCTSSTDQEGFTTKYTYDALNRKVKEIDPYGYVSSIVYDLKDNPISTTDKEGYTTKTRYNIDHHPIQIDYPDSTSEQFRYYPHGALRTKKEKDGSSIDYTYDYKGRVLTENRTDQAGNILTTKSYLYKGENLIAETDPLGFVTTYTYDNGKRLIAKTRENVTETYGYDTLNRLCTITQGNKVTQKMFDLFDRVVEERIEDLDGKVYRKIIFSYDIHDNVCQERLYTDENHVIETNTHYNSNNLPILQINGMGNQTNISYNHCPFQKVTVDPLGQMTIETYDAFKNVTSTEIPDLSKQEIIYSPNGHRIKQIDHIYQQGVEKGLSVVSWEYDSMGNLLSLVEQDLKKTTHTYLDGRLDTTQKSDGVLLYHAYDLLGKLIEQSSSDGQLCTQYSYDLNGNMLSAIDKVHDRSVVRTYDPHNNITSETTHTTLTYSYDELNRLIEICFPDSSIQYTYNPTDLVSIHRQDKTHTYLYDLAGRLIKEKTFDDTTTSYTYNDNHHLISITSPYYTQTLTYDAADNIFSTTVNRQKTTYMYDGLYQLLSEDSPICTNYYIYQSVKENRTDYTYDSLYNRLTKNNDPYQYNTLHHVLSDNENTYTYDLNGNRQTKNGITYTYDPLNRMTSAGEITYTYDALGRLQSRTSPTSEESFVYYKEIELGSLDNLKIVGKGIAGLEQKGKLYTVIRDHRGSPSLLLFKSRPVATYTYKAFGEATHTGTIHCPWQYSGHRCDADTKLLHALKRVYDPTLGRWLTPDPLGFADGPNLYAYVHNNPLIFIDPTGLFGEGLWEMAIDTYHSPRFQGGMQAFGGFAEMGAGAGMIGSTYGWGAPVGLPIIAHGMDHFYTGMKTLITGVPEDTATSQLLQMTGMSSSTANLLDNSVSLLATMGGAAVLRSNQLANCSRNFSLSMINEQQKSQILFGQKTVSAFFSEAGNFKLRPISDVAQELRMGTISPNALPLDVVMRNGQMITLNNRSLLALRRAKLEPTTIIDRTGALKYENLLDNHLKGGVPSDVIKIRGGPPRTSLINPSPR